MNRFCCICYDSILSSHRDLCHRCVEWIRYWGVLTESERGAELASMDRHVAESDGV